MRKEDLALLLNTALLSAFVSACGGAIDEGKGDSAADSASGDTAVSDTGSDTAVMDTARVDTAGMDSGPLMDAVPGDAGKCTPIVSMEPCNESVTFPCGLPIKLKAEFPDAEECNVLCEGTTSPGGPAGFGCGFSPPSGDSPSVKVFCARCAVGRRPADLEEPQETTKSDDPVTQALVDQTWMEAASVHAFRRLGQTLSGLDAPKALTARVRKAARDELRHARMVGSLARARGGKPRSVKIRPSHAQPNQARTLELARENVVEGCVNETLGVAYLAHQRVHAADAELRSLADSLYEEELEHAALSWEIEAFFDSRLNEDERAELRKARADALDKVVKEAGSFDPTVAIAFGLPNREVVKALVEQLQGKLYV